MVCKIADINWRITKTNPRANDGGSLIVFKA
jgi:hypothetical protein